MTFSDLAIVGAACRLPGGVADLTGLWDLLRAGRCAVTEIPDARWSKDAFFSPDRHAPGKAYTWAAGVIDEIDGFDPAFFGMSPREAAQTDPQQRLALELAAHAFDDAAIALDRVAGTRAGVFVGVSNHDFGDIRIADPASADAYFMTGNALSIVANRISYAFDLRGPSFVLDTACSSSLVAFDNACRALTQDTIDLALVGGVNLLLSPFPFIGFSRAGMLSPRGRCRPFDASGDGYVRAEGGGFVVVKRLEQAIADGDRIRAVVKATATNADGRTAGLSLPSSASQAALLDDIYGRAGIDPARLAYLEAHGTGTAAGDPLEAQALGRALGRRRSKPLAIGSVKGNVGHLEPASGIVGLLKALLVLEHGRIPASLHFDEPNPAIDFDELNLRVAAAAERIDLVPESSLVGVNSFGFGGANAHAVLEAPRRDTEAARPRRIPPVVVTSHAREALATEAVAVARQLAGVSPSELNDAAWTLAQRRRHEAHRLWVEGGAPAALQGRLRAIADSARPASVDGVVEGEAVGAAPEVVFVFSGNGCQYAGMGVRLLREDAPFRAAVRALDRLFEKLGGSSIEAVLSHADASSYERTELAQPALFAVQVGLVASLRARGLRPTGVIGHSVGEVAAAYTAGALTLADAASVIFHRSRAQGATHGVGAMLAVSVDRVPLQETLALVAPEVEVAGYNTDDDLTLAGPEPQIEMLAEALRPFARYVKRLDLAYAFHSRAMDPVEMDVRTSLVGLSPRRPNCVLYSTVSGDRVTGAELDADYWWRNIREPVRFADAVERALAVGPTVAFEIGPRAIVSGYVRAIGRRRERPLGMVRGLEAEAAGASDLEARLGEAFALGAQLDFSRRAPAGARVASLPQRTFVRSRHWFQASGRGEDLVRFGTVHPLLGRALRSGGARFEHDLDLAAQPWLADHEVGGAVVLPAAGFLEIALAAAASVYGAAEDGCVLAVRNLQIFRSLTLDRDRLTRLRVDVQPSDGRLWLSASSHGEPATLALHAVARVERVETGPAAEPPASVVTSSASPARLYDDVAARGLRYGPAFQRLSTLSFGPRSAEARLTGGDAHGCHVAPPDLDAAFQSLLAMLPVDGAQVFLPVAFDTFEFRGGGRPVRLRVDVVRAHRRSVVADCWWWDDSGQLVARVAGGRFREAPSLDRERRPARSLRTDLVRLRLTQTDEKHDVPDASTFTDAALRQLTLARVGGRREVFREEVGPLLAAAAAGFARRTLLPALGGGAAATIDEIAVRLEVAGASRPLLRRLIAILEEDGVLVRDAGSWRVVDATPLPEPEPILRAVIADNPDYATDALLLARAGADVPSKLRQQASTGSGEADLLRSQSFAHWQIGVPAVDLSRDVLLGGLGAFLAAWPADRALRLLNVTSGDTGFARALSRLVAGRRVHIVHAALTPEARARIDAVLQEDARVDVVDGDLARSDGLVHAPFDLIVCNHTLFLTGNDEQALRRLGASLHPEGFLVLGERQNDRLGDLLFAGQPRWWQPSTRDEMLPRLGHAQHWIAALEATGFERIDSVEDVADITPGDCFHLVARRGRAASETLAPRRHINLDAVPLPWRSGLEAALKARAPSSAEADHTPQMAERVVWSEFAAQDATAASGAIADVVGQLSAAEDGGLVWVVALTPDNGSGVAPAPAAVAALCGAVRVVANERPELALRFVDLRVTSASEQAITRLADEFAAVERGESEVVLAVDGRYVPRVTDGDIDRPTAEARPATLDLTTGGSLSRLAWRPLERREPGPGEVEIEVAAVGLNFRDVMLAMGLLGDDAVEDGFAGATLGMECAGRVVALGDGVADVAIGDRVMAFAPTCFSTHVTTTAAVVAPIPDAMSFEAAATVPTVFFSAFYALKHLGRVQPGETVLIHGAAGGVGLAAIQIAEALGADAIVTAGSQEKQDFLRLLGMDRVSTSRSLRFADEVAALTSGDGVDVVLNSLAGPAIEKSLSLLKPFGRFLELGKRDLYADTPIGLRPFRRNLAYFGIDADQVIAQQPGLARTIFQGVLEQMHAGVLRPIPHRVFDAESVGDAFAAMQASQHIGKVVVRLHPPPRPLHSRTTNASRRSFRAAADGWYVISGGLGGFGLETARWLAEAGATRLALFSRRGQAPCAEPTIAALRSCGVDVETTALDVTDAAAVARWFDELRLAAPIRGVFHTAAVFDDGPASAMDAKRIQRVVAPKLDGCAALEAASDGDDVVHFVVYSSATTLVGNPHQANYVAANCALESRMAARRARGRHGLAVLWGPIADAGYLTRNTQVKTAVQARFGRSEMSAQMALAALGDLLVEGTGERVVAHLDWSRLSALPVLRSGRRFEDLRAARPGESRVDGDGRTLAEQIAGKSAGEARTLAMAAFAQLVAGILKLPVDRITPDAVLAELGMDSLMGVELGLAAHEQFAVQLTAGALGPGVTLADLVDRVLAEAGAGEAKPDELEELLVQHAAEAEIHHLDRTAERPREPVSASKVGVVS